MMKCVLCGSSKTKLEYFGPIHSLDNGSSVHQNCLYLSPGLVQRGDDDNGTLHFLTSDIMKEAKRNKPLVCCYCHGYGANIGCCKSKCHRTFHTGCGIENNAQNQFCETFKSYCHYHVHTHKYRPKPNENCVICYEHLMKSGEKFNYVTVINSPCCQNGWYHRTCLQRYANSSGYFFKCPLCNNSNSFRDVSYWGIFIPNSDAAWELEPDAFHEQLLRDLNCTADQCISPRGRKANDELELCYCISCGSNPVHFGCKDQDMYNCKVCVKGLNSLDDPLDYFVLPQTQAHTNMSFRSTRNEEISFMNPNRDRVQQKLRAPSSDGSDIDIESDDDDAFFNSLAEIGKENINNKTTVDSERRVISGSSNPLSTRDRQTLMPDNGTNNGTSTRSRRQTLHAHIPSVRSRSRPRKDKAEVKATTMDTEVVSRRTRSRSQVAMAPTATPLRSARKKSSESINTKPRTTRRRTNVTPIRQSKPSVDLTKLTTLDISCVANRTRQRLPVYLANHK